jgi:mycofactocin glycosyltransferase
MPLDLSVVIPVRNRPQQVAECVRSVLAGTLARERYEVIVVDNGSTDETARAAADAGARVVSEPEPNRCLARNLGAAEAAAPWVAFIDSDCVAEPDWLAALARAVDAADEQTGAIAGAVLDPPAQTDVERYIAHRQWFDQEKYLAQDAPFARPFALTANLCVRRDLYLELGGLDAGLPYPGEDADWCWRALDAGRTLGWAPDARVVHMHRATLGAMWTQSVHWGVGQADLFAKWREREGRRVWIEPHRYVWAAKALIKTPWDLTTGRTSLDRRMAFYDFVSNTGMAWGRLWGGLRCGLIVI